MQIRRSNEMASAKMFAEGLQDLIGRARADIAQGRGSGEGARAPAGQARAPVELIDITGVGFDAPSTPLGYKTARVCVSPVLQALAVGDRRREAAVRYAHLVGRVGSVPISDPCGGPGGGLAGDGGAVRRCEDADALARLLACLGGVALPVVRSGRGRRPITVRAAVDGVCLADMSARGVLSAHGWSGRQKSSESLSVAVLAALSDMADKLGY